MELKDYQKTVMQHLRRYLELLYQTKNLDKAYRLLWTEQNVPVNNMGGMQPYQNIIPGVPDVCFKVPTGGGKTYLGVNAIREIFDHLPEYKAKVVVWLVPSDAILTQTLAAFRNPEHPYRQKLNADFGSRVNVLTKEELLAGQNFNISSVAENLTLMVLSYDSFRGKKEALRARRENSNLAQMAQQLGKPNVELEDADETALIQIINQLSPLVIVDESHHARSKLSKKMLTDFNPCFVLDLTATPTDESNLISVTDAIQLKREHMVKLPVFVYNQASQNEVMVMAIDLRNRLEKSAEEERESGGNYIRPIALFQAQPKVKESSVTFAKLKEQLVETGIPEEQIAIKTAETDELKGINLQDEACPIRYIITVNALKEGWDCPFAYVLASLANRSSKVEVEQIVGRILRQPYAHDHLHRELNMSYVLTSSADFKSTLDGIVKGLNDAGFSARDCRVASEEETAESAYEQKSDDSSFKDGNAAFGQGNQSSWFEQHEYMGAGDTSGNGFPGMVHEAGIIDTFDHSDSGQGDSSSEDFLNFDPRRVSDALSQIEKSPEGKEEASIPSDTSKQHMSGAADLLQQASRQQAQYDSQTQGTETDAYRDVPDEVKEKMTMFPMNREFAVEAQQMMLPCFFLKGPESSIFMPVTTTLLTPDDLTENFTLKGKSYPTEFPSAEMIAAKVDIDSNKGTVPKVYTLTKTDRRYLEETFAKLPDEQKLESSRRILEYALNKMNCISGPDIHFYITSIMSSMDDDTKRSLQDNPTLFAERITAYVEGLLRESNREQFFNWLETGRIVTLPHYTFPLKIGPLNSTSILGKSLYEAEEEVNSFEYDMALKLTGMDNVKWWHRNISKVGFCINGFVKHYPDFIVQTKSGKTVLIETKGDHLENQETKDKIALGRAWEKAAGPEYKYYMVFQSKDLHLDGAYPMDKFLSIMSKL